MAYDSRTDRATYSAEYGFDRSDTPWQYCVSWNGKGGKAIKRQTHRKLRHMETVTRQHEMFGKRVYCKCCCTAMC